MAVAGASQIGSSKRGRQTVRILLVVILAMICIGPRAQSQTFQVIHNFTGLGDGSEPTYGLTLDAGGNIYGTTFNGNALTGTVYKLTNKGGNWIENPLYYFPYQGSGGSIPYSPVVQGKDGSYYGTAASGGNLVACPNGTTLGCGAVYNLKPLPSRPPTPLTQWTYTPIYIFNNSDGANPYGVDLIFAADGSIYGTTSNGGTGTCFGGCGVVFQLTPSNGTYTETVLYSFTQGTDGAHPWSGVIFDQAGNLYGTTTGGGTFGNGTVYQLTKSGSTWTEKILYNFTGGADGANPYAALGFDAAGNLYGATVAQGAGMGGTVFELSPAGGGNWSLQTLFAFNGNGGQLARGPYGRIILLGDGTIYGTTASDGLYNFGSVFKLTPGSGGYTYTSLHDFTGGLDGGYPRGYPVMDKNGNIFGTTTTGGTGDPTNCVGACGVVYEVAP